MDKGHRAHIEFICVPRLAVRIKDYYAPQRTEAAMFQFWINFYRSQRVEFYMQHVTAESVMAAMPGTIAGVANVAGC